jgi:hypothetical protein
MGGINAVSGRPSTPNQTLVRNSTTQPQWGGVYGHVYVEVPYPPIRVLCGRVRGHHVRM